MGISSFPTPSEGMLPLIVINSVLTMTLLKNMLRSVLQVLSPQRSEEQNPEEIWQEVTSSREHRRVSVTQFRSLLCQSNNNNNNNNVTNTNLECCVCLCGFESEEEVSELSCKHFFHKYCLDKWFANKHTSCPLCRSIH